MRILEQLAAIRVETRLLLGILLIGAFLRLYQLDAVPAGLSTDEATAGVNAEAVLDGDWKLFYHPFDEPLFVYASAAGVALFGPTVLGLHAAAAAFGILSIVGLYLLARKLFGSEVALLAAAALAIAFWPLHTSRLGFRAIALPALELFAFYFLWRALKEKQLLDYAVGGIVLGLSLYTYASSRVLPLIVVLFLLGFLVLERTRRVVPYHPLEKVPRAEARGLLLYAVTAVLTFLPLGLYFWQTPASFSGRFETTSTLPSAPTVSFELAASFSRTLEMFAFSGDPQWKYNVSGQPIFNPIWAVLFFGGLLLALRRGLRPEYLFLLLWFALGLLPGILTGEAPHNLRTIVSQPAAYIFPALAMGAVIKRMAAARPRVVAYSNLILLIFFAVSAAGTFQDYFVRWANDPHVAELFYPDIAQAMRFLHTLKPEDRVYLSAQAPDLETIMRNYYAWRQPVPLPKLFDAGRGIVVNPRARSVYIIPSSAPASPAVEAVLRQGAVINESGTTDKKILFRAYSLDNVQIPAPATALNTRFGNLIELIGYDLEGSLESGRQLNIDLYGKPLQRAVQEGDYKFFVHLVDSTGYIWAQDDGIGADPAQWNADELVLSSFSLAVPADAPPQDYHLEIGLYSLTHGRLPALDSQGNILGTVANTATLRLTRGGGIGIVENGAAQRVSDLQLGDQLALAAFEVDERADPGSSLRLTLYWKLLAPASRDDRLQLSLLDGAGNVAAQVQSELVGPLYPLTAWKPGEIIRNSYLLPIPAEMPAGDYKLAVTLADPDTNKTVGPTIALASIQVSNVAHRFTVPPIQNPLAATLGDSIDFLGYSLAPDAKVGTILPLTAYWRARQTMPVSYTAFVHLIDQTNRVWAQRDRLPGNGQRPTTSWVKDEVIVDRFNIPVPADTPPGQYSIEIGMYNPDTLQRLPVYSASGERMEGDRIILTPVNIIR